MHPELCLLEATNRNGLTYFLLANLLTGLVNISMETIFVGPIRALQVLVIYMFVLSLVFAGLHVKNVTLRIW